MFRNRSSKWPQCIQRSSTWAESPCPSARGALRVVASGAPSDATHPAGETDARLTNTRRPNHPGACARTRAHARAAIEAVVIQLGNISGKNEAIAEAVRAMIRTAPQYDAIPGT